MSLFGKLNCGNKIKLSQTGKLKYLIFRVSNVVHISLQQLICFELPAEKPSKVFSLSVCIMEKSWIAILERPHSLIRRGSHMEGPLLWRSPGPI